MKVVLDLPKSVISDHFGEFQCDKILEEAAEVKDAFLELGEGFSTEKLHHLCEEMVDTMVACMTGFEQLGVSEEYVANMVEYVLEKNKGRGFYVG